MCQTERTKTTLAGGIYDRNAHYVYKHPANWVTIPWEEEITRGDIVAELYDRVAPMLIKAAQ